MTPEEHVAALAAKEQELKDAHQKVLADKDRELTQAQHTIVTLKKSKEEQKPAAQEVDIEAIETKALSKAQEEIEKFKVEQSKDTFDDILATFTLTPEEKEKVRGVYDNSIVKTGFNKESIRKDLENAFIIANKAKFESTMSELRQAAISKATQSNGSASSQETDRKDENNLSDAEKLWAKQTSIRMKKPEAEVIALLMANKKK